MNRIYYAVIDTNILVSSLFKKDSVPGWIIDRVIEGVIIPLINDEILEEYNDVLFRNNFNFDQLEVNSIIDVFTKQGIQLERSETDELFIDQDDIVFYEIVLSGRNRFESYLVTGNKRHFPNKTFVVSPREMKDIIENNN